MRDYSRRSASYPCQACPEDRQKVVYLTFDDGPEPGTINVFNLLREMGVPGTFFMVGENVIAHETGVLNRLGLNMSPAPGLFKLMFDSPLIEIANHSQTQAHQFYQSYYESGLRIEADRGFPSADPGASAARRSVLVDFELANVAFSLALNGVPGQYTQERAKVSDQSYRGDNVRGQFSADGIGYFRFLAARLPGTNRWRIPENRSSVIDWGGADRDDEADDLEDNGYRVYGWDLEWQMTNETSRMSDDVRAEHLAGEDGWWDGYRRRSDDIHDHLQQSADTIFNRTRAHLNSWRDGTAFESSSDAKCVILMHDRQFRAPNNGGSSNPYIDALRAFIEKCQAEGYNFDVISNY